MGAGQWEVQGQSPFFTTGGHGWWSQQEEAQMVTSTCLPSPCSVVGTVLGRQRRKGQRSYVLRELAVWGSALSNGCMVTLTEEGFCAMFRAWPRRSTLFLLSLSPLAPN